MIREINTSIITETVKEMCIHANHFLSEDMDIALKKATEKEEVDTSFNFLLKIIRFVIYAIAVFLIITELGINLNGLIAGFGITGLIVTLAAQDTAKKLIWRSSHILRQTICCRRLDTI